MVYDNYRPWLIELYDFEQAKTTVSLTSVKLFGKQKKKKN